MLKLYENIRKKRNELNMSQDTLASKTGYSDKGMISKIESGKVDLPLSKIKLFAIALNTTCGDLMGWEDNDAPVPPSSPDLAASDQKLLHDFHRLDDGAQEGVRRQISTYIECGRVREQKGISRAE